LVDGVVMSPRGGPPRSVPSAPRDRPTD